MNHVPEINTTTTTTNKLNQASTKFYKYKEQIELLLQSSAVAIYLGGKLLVTHTFCRGLIGKGERGLHKISQKGFLPIPPLTVSKIMLGGFIGYSGGRMIRP